jgi:ubiquitin carboxyl-terminal hydrolase 8
MISLPRLITAIQEYTKYIHRRVAQGHKLPERETFGGKEQQDAQEFFSFLITQLHDETNRHRDKPGDVPRPSGNDGRSLLHLAIEYYNSYSLYNDSIIDRYWRGIDAQVISCSNCDEQSEAMQVFDLITLAIPHERKPCKIETMLAQFTEVEWPENCNCEKCGKPKCRRMALARMPDRLHIQFRRFGTTLRKVSAPVEFPLLNLDMMPYFIPPSQCNIQKDASGTDGEIARMASEDRHFRGPFKYECYAVIHHIGATIHGGHYKAYVRDEDSADPHAWFEFNDTQVTTHHIGGERDNGMLRRLYGHGEGQPYMVFYKRKGT